MCFEAGFCHSFTAVLPRAAAKSRQWKMLAAPAQNALPVLAGGG